MASKQEFQYLVSSDWSECLSPNGPFDPLIHVWPELESDLTRTFSSYTSNEISLSRAIEEIQALLPRELTSRDMDAFLRERFAAYNGLSRLINWCLSRGAAFMINSTGPMGYFQRAMANGFLPRIPLLSAHPFLQYPSAETDPEHIFPLREIEDKGVNTQAALDALDIPPQNAAVVGDSGGDGPHFAWAAERGALRIGVNTKSSLESYCAERGITIHSRVGVAYRAGESRDKEAESQTDLTKICQILQQQLFS